MSVVTRDKHGTWTKRRRESGTPLDRATAKHYAVVQNVWRGGYATKAEAQKVEREMQLASGEAQPRRGSMTLAEFGEAIWLPAKRDRLRASSYAECDIYWRTRIKPALGERRLRDLRAQDLREFYRSLGTRTAPEKCHKHLSNLLALALDEGYVQVNVAQARNVRPKHITPEMQAWNPEELREFLSYVRDDRLYALWRVLAMTGLRRGEACGLVWANLDLRAATLAVTRSLVLAPDGTVAWDAPKTLRSRRVIDIDAETVSVLRGHRGRQAVERNASLGAWPHEGSEADLVFTDQVGRALRPAYVSRRFGDLLKKQESLRTIRLHDLRHTHATILLGEDIPVHVVSQRLGHASSSVTLDVYAHVLRDQGSDAAERFAAAVDH